MTGRPSSPRRTAGCRAAQVLAVVAAGALVAPATAAEPSAAPLRFTRVHVPAGRLGDVAVGSERLVPMPVADFDRLVEAASAYRGGAGGPPHPVADSARITCRFDAGGRASGTLTLLYPDDTAAVPAAVSLGRLAVVRATRQAGEGTGPAVVFAGAAGDTAVRITGPGTYRCDWRLEGLAPGSGSGAAPAVLELPLAPALVTVLDVEVPPGQRPLGGGVAWEPVPRGPTGAPSDGTVLPGPRAWRAVVGPAASVIVRFVPEGAEPGGVRVWTTHEVGLGGIRVRTLLVPAVRWDGDTVHVRLDPEVTVVSAAVATAGPEARRPVAWVARGDGVDLHLPVAVVGSAAPLEIAGIAPATMPRVRLPRAAPVAESWWGGGLTVRIDPALAVARVEPQEAAAVPATVAATWPGTAAARRGETHATLHFSPQGPDAVVHLALEPRGPILDIARVSVIDVAAARLLGVATCDIRVPQGEAFALTGRVGAGWIIDAVEAITPGGKRAAGPPAAVAWPGTPADDVVDWRVTAEADASRLRIGLASAATGSRPLGLRITGHRAGIDVGGTLAAADLEMVALDGETDGQTALVLRAPADATLSIDPPPAPLPPPVSRVAALMGDEPVRAVLPAGASLPEAEVRLVPRRAPVDVHCRIGSIVREDRVAESFSFECRPGPGEAALDSLVVHFSEPIEELSEWTILSPTAGSVVARPVEVPGQRGGESSWLIEFVPAAREAVTIRATRSVPLAGATPVPLARVEGAVGFVGEVVIRAAGRRRPTVVNRRLTELPPAPSPAGAADEIVAEFGFGADDAVLAATEGPSLELVPDGAGGERDARAWVWSETVDCWCHRSGRTEVEARLEIENHGRGSLTLLLPPGNELQAILLDGRRVALETEGGVGEIVLDLPVERRRMTLTVRSIAADTAAPGVPGWFVSSAGCTVDLPVMERAWRVWLPPGVELLAGPGHHREVRGPHEDWCRRLTGLGAPAIAATGADVAGATADGGLVAGCRERVFVPLPGRPDADRVRLVAAEDLDRAAFLVGALVTGCVLAVAAWRPGVLLVMPLLAGLAALWLPPPWHGLARATAWGLVAAALATWYTRRRRRPPGGVLLAAGALIASATAASGAEPAAGAGDGDPLRVIVTPVGGVPTALVPQRLFAALGNAGDWAAPRVLHAEVVIPGPRDPAPWTIRLDVDSDPGASLVVPLDAGDAGHAEGVLVDGRPVPLFASAGGPSRVPITEAGRHRVEWRTMPAVELRGEVTVATVRLPAAPLAAATVGPGRGGTESLVEMARPGQPWGAAPAESPWVAGATRRFDIAGADRVCLLTADDPAVPLAAIPGAARSRNDVTWGPAACRVDSRFEIEVGDGLLPSAVVRVDPRLAPLPSSDEAIALEPLGPGRYRIVRSEPRRGDVELDLAWTMPLDEATGVHVVPEAWLEAPLADDRSVRFTPAAGMRAAALPHGVGPGSRPGATASELAWKVDRAAAEGGGGPADGMTHAAGAPAARVFVTRAPLPVRGTQQLRVALGRGRVGMALESRIESENAIVAIPLRCRGDVHVGKVTVTDESGPDGARHALDVRVVPDDDGDGWSVVLQQPRSGRLRLDAEAFQAVPGAVEGDLPTLEALLDGGGPLVVSWSAADGMAAEVAGAEVAAAGVFELPGEEPAPAYRLVDVPRRVAEPPAASGAVAPSGATVAPLPAGPRLELVETLIAIDARGRCWGTARLDVVATDPLVRVTLPEGCRPFKVFVDGRPVADPVPVGDASVPRWEIRLLDIRWPRSLEVVFAGDLGSAIDGGDLTSLAPAGIEGLPAATTLWTILVPRGTAVRVANPAAQTRTSTLAGGRAAALERVAGEFNRAIAEGSPAEAARLGDLLAARRAARPSPAVDRAWGAMGVGAFAVGAAVVGPPDGAPLELRLVRAIDPTVPGRAVAAAALVAVCGAVRTLARRPARRVPG